MTTSPDDEQGSPGRPSSPGRPGDDAQGGSVPQGSSPAGGAQGVVTPPPDALARLLDRRTSADGAQAEALLRALVDASPIAMWMIDPDGRVLLWNRAVEQLTGWSADDVLGKPVPLVPADKREEFRTLIGRVMRKESVVDAEVRRQKKDGTLVDLSLSIAPLTTSDGAVVAILAMATDLTVRKEAEETARRLATERAARAAADAARALLTGIVESIGDAYAAFDREWRFAYVNRHYAALVRRNRTDPEALIGRVLWDVFPEIVGTKFHSEALGAVARRQAVEFDEYYAPLDVTFNVRVFPTPDGVVSISRDVSERRRAERALEQSESRFRSLVEASSQIVWTTDPEGRIVTPLAEWTALTGQTPVEATGYGMLDAVHPDDRDEVDRLWRESIRTKSPFSATFRLRVAEGSYRWFAARGVAVVDVDGSVREWVGTSTDIHQRKSAEAALRESEARFRDTATALRESEQRHRRIFETVEVSIWDEDFSAVKAAVDTLKANDVTDIRRYLAEHPEFVAEAATLVRVTDVNDATLSMFGARDKSELLSSPQRVFVPATLEVLAEELVAVFEGRERFQSEAPVQTLDGRPMQVAFTVAFPAEDPQLRSVLVSMIDITNRKRAEAEREQLLGAERAARERTERLQAVTAALIEPVTVEDVADRVVETMRATSTARSASLALLTRDGSAFEVVRMIGVPADVAAKWQRYPADPAYPSTHAARTGEPVFLRSLEEMQERFPTIVDGARAIGFMASAVIPLVVAGTTVGILGFNYDTPQPFDAGKRAYLAAVAQQCAQALERARLFEAERAARDESEAARREADTARATAEEASRAKSDFLATMSHELRTPLNAIIGYQNLLADGVTGPVSDAQHRQLERIGASARHLLMLIDEVLTLSRAEAGKETAHVEPVDVARILDEAATIIEPLTTPKNLAFHVVPPESRIIIETDEGKARQAVLNLLSNAVKFTGRGSITLRAWQAGDMIHFEVRDTGIGIAAEHLERIFDPFWQVEASTTRTAPGTGLGLAVTRRLAHLLGGEVTVQSALGEGSTFTLQLPRVAPQPHAGRFVI